MLPASFVPPFPIFSILVQWTIGALVLAMLIRMIANWFRVDERFALIRFLIRLTDPFISPFRRILRPVGVLDLSFIVAWFVLSTMRLLLLQSLPPGW